MNHAPSHAATAPRRHPLASAVRRWTSGAAVFALFATPAIAVTVGVGQTVDITGSGTLSLTMDGGILRLSSPSGMPGLSLATTNAVLARGMIYNASGATSTLNLFGTTQLPGAPVGAPPADGMYLNASYFDSGGLDVVNKGTLNQTGTGEFTLLGVTRFINDTGAVFSIQNDKGLKEFTGGSRNIVGFLNNGTFQKSGTTGASDILVPFDQQGGQVLLSSGILTLQRGGTHDSAVFNADAALTGHSGYIQFGGAHAFSDVTTLTGAFVLDGSIEVKQSKGWRQRGDFYAQGPITLGAGSTLNNSGNLYLNNTTTVAISAATTGTPPVPAATMINSGTVRMEGSTSITNAGTLQNSGLLRLQDSSGIWIGPAATLVNSGSLWLLDNSAVTIAPGGVLRNSGDVQASSTLLGAGKLENLAGGTFSGNIFGGPQTYLAVRNEGQFTIASDNVVTVGQFDHVAGTLTVDGALDVFGGHLDMSGGTLNGTGVINGDVFVGGGTTTARFTPGHSPGTMVINGDFSLLPGGVIELEAGYVDAFVDADRIFVSNGDVLLAGHISFLIGPDVTLDDLNAPLFACVDACSITYGSTFSYDFPGRPGSQLELVDSELRIVALGDLGGVAPVPEPSTLLTMLAGVGAMGLVVRRRRGARPSVIV